MIDHIGLNVPNLESAKSYYDIMMPPLGYEPFFATDEQFKVAGREGRPKPFGWIRHLPSSVRRSQIGQR